MRSAPPPPAAVASVAPVVVEDVGKTFGRKRALAGVSTTLAPGEVTAILGPNGAGKSTLLAVLATLSAPTTGRVRWGAVELQRGSAARAAIGYVGHDPGLYLDLSARQNLGLFGRLYGVPDPDERALLMLERVGLGDVPGDAPARTFSRGMQQRLALARALLHEPRLLLFDEPGSALDPAGAAWLGEQLLRERAAGRVVVLVTHDLDAAGALAEHVVVMRRGRVGRDERRPAPLGPAALRALYDEAARG
jgi:ABC-type multidrug transport system ATPase subunit